MEQFDEFFKWNCNLKITRQIDLVLHNLVYECCNLTNFSCLWISKIWFGIVKSIKSWINGKKAVEANSPSLCRTSVATYRVWQRKATQGHWSSLEDSQEGRVRVSEGSIWKEASALPLHRDLLFPLSMHSPGQQKGEEKAFCAAYFLSSYGQQRTLKLLLRRRPGLFLRHESKRANKGRSSCFLPHNCVILVLQVFIAYKTVAFGMLSGILVT